MLNCSGIQRDDVAQLHAQSVDRLKQHPLMVGDACRYEVIWIPTEDFKTTCRAQERVRLTCADTQMFFCFQTDVFRSPVSLIDCTGFIGFLTIQKCPSNLHFCSAGKLDIKSIP